MSIAVVLRELMNAGLQGEALVQAVERIEAAQREEAQAVARARLIPPEVRDEVIARDGARCVYCGNPAATIQLDHVMPSSRGGASLAENLVVSCKSCNSSKRDRTPKEWRGL